MYFQFRCYKVTKIFTSIDIFCRAPQKTSGAAQSTAPPSDQRASRGAARSLRSRPAANRFCRDFKA